MMVMKHIMRNKTWQEEYSLKKDLKQREGQ